MGTREGLIRDTDIPDQVVYFFHVKNLTENCELPAIK